MKGITLTAVNNGPSQFPQGAIVLDEQCPACAGTGLTCGECEGIGSVPTENGLQLLAFLRRHNAAFKVEES
jgi:hypothetical protein